jgi:O-methyltransferase
MGNRFIDAALRRIGRRPAFGELQDSDLEGLSEGERRIVEQAWPYTMTSVARLTAVIDSVRHCVRRNLPGDFAECGVWLGGSILAMILTLQDEGVRDRDVWLYDTFEGMTRPTEHDVSRFDPPALEAWSDAERRVVGRWWSDHFDPQRFSEEGVREVMLSTGYPEDRIRFVRGPVEETLPRHSPDRLSLLRLDTDWYESTRHELIHLYPRLSMGGVLIVDDYGHWEGCRRAVDEYFASEAPRVLLSRIDYTARIAIKS